jgi:hypothetical protein
VEDIDYGLLSTRLKTKMQTCLATPEGLDPLVRERYLASADVFSGIVLSPLGAHGMTLTLCKECHSSLKSRSAKPPKFSLANGFCVGLLADEFKDLRQVEKALCSMVTISTVRNDHHDLDSGR